MQHTNSNHIEDIDKFTKQVIDILNKACNESFLTLKLLLSFNDKHLVPFENINSFLSMFFDKNKYPLNDDLYYFIYSNPIHVCALLSHASNDTCKRVIARILNELNVIPCGYPIYFKNKLDLIFYSMLFGADAQDIALLRTLIQSNVDKCNEFFNIKVADNSYVLPKTESTDHVQNESTSILTDFLSIKYNDERNRHANSFILQSYTFPVTELDKLIHSIPDSFIRNETSSRDTVDEYTDAQLKSSYIQTLYLLASNSDNLHKCIQYIDEFQPDVNFKRACKNIFMCQMKFNIHKFTNIPTIKFIDYIQNPNKCYDELLKATTSTNNLELKVNPQAKPLIEFFVKNTQHPVQLAHVYKLLKHKCFN